jgi:CelD/BcsL family acetyltransferase involved in cellulose biosynthesis
VQRHLLAPGHGTLFLARHEGRPVAGILCLRFGRHVVYKYGASDERFQHLRANNLVMWEALRHYAATGHTLFDFGRTSLDNEGLRRFKRSWGATEATVGYLRLDPSTGTPLSAPDRASGWHNAVFRHLPLPLSRAAGALLYKHLG